MFPFEVIERTQTTGKCVLLDTNIWRYVVDAKAAGKLLSVTHGSAYQVQIAPAVLYETLRLGDHALRDAIVRIMTNDRFTRLMTEAYSESMEILREIKRARPDWIKDRPDIAFFDRLKKDWTRKRGGFWVRCAKSPGIEARYIASLDNGMIEGGRNQARMARKEIIEAGWKRNPPMDKTMCAFPEPTRGWNGSPFEAWRADSLSSLTFALAQRGNAYRDWIAPFVELDTGLLTSAGWIEFWIHLADTAALPRQWMRWAHAFSQRFRTVTQGTPGDCQLSTYFLETDFVVSADKALIATLEECRPYAPCTLPVGKLVPSGSPGVDALLRFLDS